MKQDRKIWTVILAIIVIGVGSTFLTKAYVSSRRKQLSLAQQSQYSYDSAEEVQKEPETDSPPISKPKGPLAEEGREMDSPPVSGGPPAVSDTSKLQQAPGGGGLGSADASARSSDAGPGMEAAEAAPQMAAAAAKEAAGEAVADSQENTALTAQDTPALIDADPDSAAAPNLAAEAAEEKAEQEQENAAVLEAVDGEEDYQAALREYETRLSELDVQIERMRSQETENTVQSVKSAARTEQGIWERELDAVYVLLMSSLDEVRGAQLRTEQQQWIETRDAAALEASRKSGGGSLESVEYIASIAASTRKRVYDLVKQYQ